jgi:hypothetical protein
MNAPFGWLTQSQCHIQCADCQIPFHTITDSPANDTSRIQVHNDRQIQPAFAGPYIRDVASPFLIGPLGREILIQQVEGTIKGVVAVRRNLELLRSDDLDAIFAHQTADPAVPNLHTQFLSCVVGHNFAGSDDAAHVYGPK